MSTTTDVQPAKDARLLPLHHVLPRLLRDPVNALARFGVDAHGEIVRLNLGPFRPYLASHPDHVQHVLRGNWQNYTRDGVFWRPLQRLFGESILSTGPSWKMGRKVFHPVFAAKNVDSLADRMAEAVNEEIDRWGAPSELTQPIHVTKWISRVVSRTIIRVFFGNKITVSEAERLISAIESISTAVVFRYLLPFMPYSAPVPGDRAFRRAVRTIDEIIIPLARRYRRSPDGEYDLFAVLAGARDADGNEPSEQWVRDNLVAMFATGTETTIAALTWLWPVLANHPKVAARLYEEIDLVVGRDQVRSSHLANLRYTKQVVQELIRLYPVGWLFPRVVAESETVDGVLLRSGETVLISPYVTHRLPEFWSRPLHFDPDRFTEENSAGRHKFAYFPFGGGPHICLGMHVFNTEAQLIIAAILSRFRPVSCSPPVVTPLMGASLSPRERVELTLRPAV